ncbi:MAG: hypothetical protein FJX76_12325 [Armatimonadetes bacterium]|nr:hypothetical protein [Armatimonadota bacterium]
MTTSLHRFLGRGKVAALFESSGGEIVQVFNLKPSEAEGQENAPTEQDGIPWAALDAANLVGLGKDDPPSRGDFARDWFVRAVREIHQWKHAALPTIERAGVAGDRGVLVLKGSGQSLLVRVEEQGVFSEEGARKVAAGLLDLLGALHGRTPETILGEIRPSNLWVDAQGGAHVLTFGEGRFIEPPRRVIVNRGGSPFNSPERRKNSRETRASDIYCVGALLYFLVSGHDPDFDVPLRQVAPSAGEVLERVVMRCLQEKAHRRYQDVGQLRGALEGREPPPPDERPWDLQIRTGNTEHGPVLPGEVIDGSFDIRNNGGGTMECNVDPSEDWIMVNPKEFEGNEETIHYWGNTEKLMPDNRHSGIIRISAGKQVKMVTVNVMVKPVPKMNVVQRSGWTLRFWLPLAALAAAAFWYATTHGSAALMKFFK